MTGSMTAMGVSAGSSSSSGSGSATSSRGQSEGCLPDLLPETVRVSDSGTGSNLTSPSSSRADERDDLLSSSQSMTSGFFS